MNEEGGGLFSIYQCTNYSSLQWPMMYLVLLFFQLPF